MASLTDLEFATPRVFFAGFVNINSDFVGNASPGAREAWVIQGIDVYATVQPNNGDLIVSASSSGWPVPNATIFQIQQSANFPGPYYWRGNLPLYNGNNLFTVSSTVPFAFTVWGVACYDFSVDGGRL